MRAWLRFGCGNLGLVCTVCKYILLPKLKRHGEHGRMVERKTNKHVTCRPLRSRAPNTLASNASGWGFFFGCRCPSPPSLAPKRESEGVSSCLSCPLQCLPPPCPASMPPGLRTASTPLACVPRQCPRPARRINALACAPHQHPRPVRRVNAPSLRAVSTPPRCVDAPSLRAASTPPPLPLHSLPLH